MKYVVLLILGLFTANIASAQYDSNNRQACIDELKSEVDKVCDPKVQENMGTVMGMLKDSGFIAQTDSRVKRICSYHCPQDITEKCYALLGRGGGMLADALSGKLDVKKAYAEGCAALKGRIEVAKKEMADADKTAGAGNKNVDSGLAKGSFRKPSGTSAPAAAPAPKKSSGKCNPYSASGAFELGKCPE